MSSELVILAYSGGLDTSCILKWILEKGYKVVCFMADVGQDEDFEEAKLKALNIGAKEVIIKDLKQDFVENYVWPSIQMGLIYEERYLLGTSVARPCITHSLIQVANEMKAKYIAHGATGKGNDQVRFELSAYVLHPEIKVIAPWRLEEFCDRFQGRSDLLEYAKKHGIPLSVTPKSPWSMDANLMHISYEAGVLENPATKAPEDLYQMTKNPLNAPRNPYKITLHFKNGLPVVLEDHESRKSYENSVEILKTLNKIGGLYGVGRIDIVENRFIGLKSRGIYETPGGTILYKAHQDLELFCLDREVYRLKHNLSVKMSEFVYNGLWFSPEAKYARECIKISQNNVNGSVTMNICPGFISILGRQSFSSSYSQSLSSMDTHGSFDPSNATGFIELNAIRLKHNYDFSNK